MNRRELLSLAAAAPWSRGLAQAAEAKKQIKITGLETDLLRLPPASFTGDAIHDFGAAAGLPVYKMLGAVRDRMPAYAMCGWYRENDKDHSQYKRTINETLETGYRAFKVKVGRFGLDDDVERIEVGFKTAGKGIRIMVDANQAFNRVEALRRGRVYQQLGCFWYEEPLVPYDHEGYAELAAALDMRVACGENDYNKHA